MANSRRDSRHVSERKNLFGRWRHASAVAVLAAVPTIGLLSGCDSATDRADAEVDKLLTDASKAAADARIPSLDKAAQVKEASPAKKVIAQVTAGDTELAAARADALEADRYAVTISNHVIALNRMTGDVNDATRVVSNLAKLEPAAAKQDVQAKLKELQDGDNGAWVAAAVPLQSLTATKATIADLQSKIAAAETKAKDLGEKQAAALTEADKLQEQSVAAKGKQSVDIYKQASAKRKEAADLLTQINVVKAGIVPLKQDLEIAQAQEQLRTAAIADFEARGKTIDDGWTNVKAASDTVAAGAKDIVSGDPKGAGSMTQTIADLAKSLDEYNKLVTSSTEHFDNAVAHYNSASTAAETYGRDLGQMASAKPDAPENGAIKGLQATFNPSIYKLQKAQAQSSLALLLARQAELAVSRSNAVAEIGKATSTAQIPAPAGVDQLGSADDAKALVTKASEAFGAAIDTLTNVAQGNATGPVATDAKNYALVSQMLAEYNWGRFAGAVGDTAASNQHIATAKQLRTEVQDSLASQNKVVLPALPSELAIQTAAPAPAGAPAPGAAPAPAPGAAPAPGSTPVPTAPVETPGPGASAAW